jgi:2,4-dienoyl-CoA reductase-like NADH-dependent reductase (Old Yellow Enzyme family)
MRMSFAKPRPLTIPEIHDLVKRFGNAAEKLYQAGADGIQLHAAHGQSTGSLGACDHLWEKCSDKMIRLSPEPVPLASREQEDGRGTVEPYLVDIPFFWSLTGTMGLAEQYGGDLDGRSRIVFEIYQEVRRRVPDKKFILSVKM